MRIEVINTGSELMLGQILNTHLGYFSTQLSRFGLKVDRQATVPDDEMIEAALRDAYIRADVILLTGGLGPTSDDLTREIIADFCNAPLEFDPAVHEEILAYFRQRHLTPPESVRAQALVPLGAGVLKNTCGTAPGLHLQKRDRHIFCLPGPPSELHPMFEEQVLPILQKLAPEKAPLLSKTLRSHGIGESAVQDKVGARLREIASLEVGYCAHPGAVDIRLVTVSPTDLIAGIEILHDALGPAVFGEGTETLEQVVIELAARREKTLATAESCTGGLVSHLLTNVPGSSQAFMQGWVVYSNASKVQELGVNPETLREHGSVSRAVAEEMARGALERSGCDLAVALTGLAGPDGGTPEKPVGLVFICLARREGEGILIQVDEKHLVPQREVFKRMAAQHALDLLRRALLAN
jgi:nicotinamide-nucleotide amidase